MTQNSWFPKVMICPYDSQLFAPLFGHSLRSLALSNLTVAYRNFKIICWCFCFVFVFLLNGRLFTIILVLRVVLIKD